MTLAIDDRIGQLIRGHTSPEDDEVEVKLIGVSGGFEKFLAVR